MADLKKNHIIVAEVRDNTGVISRIAGFFTRRGYSIQNLVTSETTSKKIRHLTFEVNNISHDEVQLLINQMKRIEEVEHVVDASGTGAITREYMLITIICPPEKNLEIMQVCQMLEVKILSRENGAVIIEAVGTSQKLDDITRLFETYEIKEIVRSGPICAVNMQ